MSDRTATTWTCDRCGDVYETPTTEQPRGWTRIYMVDPPKAEYDHKNPTHGKADLCRTCTRAVRNSAFCLQPMAAEAAS